MISKTLNCIYIHIPKTGGMSIETILGADIKTLHQESIKIKHGYPSDWIYPKYWMQYYKFTFVRNPWDRIVSSYFYNLKMAKKNINSNDHDRKKIKVYGYEGFNDYVINDLEKSKSRFFLPYHHWIGDYEYDFIGKLENFEENMKLVCRNLQIRFKNIHINKSKRQSYQEYYNNKAKNIVGDIYRNDIDNFKYYF